jgi:hypothetical protein
LTRRLQQDDQAPELVLDSSETQARERRASHQALEATHTSVRGALIQAYAKERRDFNATSDAIHSPGHPNAFTGLSI